MVGVVIGTENTYINCCVTVFTLFRFIHFTVIRGIRYCSKLSAFLYIYAPKFVSKGATSTRLTVLGFSNVFIINLPFNTIAGF